MKRLKNIVDSMRVWMEGRGEHYTGVRSAKRYLIHSSIMVLVYTTMFGLLHVVNLYLCKI